MGVLFPGGLHLRMFPMKTSFLENPIAFIILVRSSPALPTKGFPVASSVAPGASPTKKSFAKGFPSPGTVFFLLFQRGHFLHAEISSAISSSFDWRGRMVNPPEISLRNFPYSFNQLPVPEIFLSSLKHLYL